MGIKLRGIWVCNLSATLSRMSLVYSKNTTGPILLRRVTHLFQRFQPFDLTKGLREPQVFFVPEPPRIHVLALRNRLKRPSNCQPALECIRGTQCNMASTWERPVPRLAPLSPGGKAQEMTFPSCGIRTTSATTLNLAAKPTRMT